MPETVTTPVDPMNPTGLGVTRCTTCGQPVDLVGHLCDDGNCRLCSHDLARFDVLADELQAHLHSWIAACRQRKISDVDIKTVFEIVIDCELDRSGVLA